MFFIFQMIKKILFRLIMIVQLHTIKLEDVQVLHIVQHVKIAQDVLTALMEALVAFVAELLIISIQVRKRSQEKQLLQIIQTSHTLLKNIIIQMK